MAKCTTNTTITITIIINTFIASFSERRSYSGPALGMFEVSSAGGAYSAPQAPLLVLRGLHCTAAWKGNGGKGKGGEEKGKREAGSKGKGWRGEVDSDAQLEQGRRLAKASPEVTVALGVCVCLSAEPRLHVHCISLCSEGNALYPVLCSYYCNKLKNT